jgi:hypothetical protein
MSKLRELSAKWAAAKDRDDPCPCPNCVTRRKVFGPSRFATPPISPNTDGWIVSLKRGGDCWMRNKRSTVVMARSDIGPLEAWDEALRIAVREDAREAERATLSSRGE